jgi:hypothetical protein
MLRHAAAVALALTFNPALVSAQDTVFTVNVQSADVYKAPSNVTPVIGHASRGTVLAVSRNLGSWVKVAWPEAPDGVGFVHVSTGRVTPLSGAAPVTKTSARSSSAAAQGTAAIPPVLHPPVRERERERAAPPRPQSQATMVTPASHIVGIGGMIGSMSSYGATARAWRDNRFAVQVGVTRDAMTSDVAAGRVTSVQFEPGVMYAFSDRVSDYLWMRPYVGSTVSFRHQTLDLGPNGPLAPATSNGVGLRFFGGTELTFAAVPRFGLSADLGYRHVPTPFPGFDPSPLSLSIAGHWYIK